MFFWLLFLYYLVLIVLFDLLFIPGAFGHGSWWLLSTVLAKVAVALAMASPALVSRRRWHVWMIAPLLTLWIVANGMYYHATGLYITFDVLSMAKGLEGFTSSLATYFRWDVWLIIILSLGVIPIFGIKTHEPSWHKMGRVWIAIVLCSLTGCFCHYFHNYKYAYEGDNKALTTDYFRILDFYGECKPKAWRDGENWYIERHSIALALPHLFVHGYNQYQAEKQNAYITFSEDEEAFLHRPTTECTATPNGHLVILLVESLESWALEEKDACGKSVMPSLNEFKDNHPVLFAPSVFCQKRYGESGDGQLIINTGLLPVKEGVACMKYANRTFPNFAHFFSQSAIVNPVRNAWNQTIMTERYGYRQLVEPQGVTMKESWNDAQVMEKTLRLCDSLPGPACIMALTISSHTPFDRVSPTLKLRDDLDPERQAYLQCLHYADSCIGNFLRWADTASCMKGATIVITGDHNIFSDGVCPLIVLSPKILESTTIEEECYQMDLYPTLLWAIGQEGYGWQGFGANLTDKEAIANRPIAIESAFVLSDKLIRKDYFRGKL